MGPICPGPTFIGGQFAEGRFGKGPIRPAPVSPRPPGASSDRRRQKLSYPRRPEDAGLDQLGSVTLSRGLVPDLDFWVPGHRR